MKALRVMGRALSGHVSAAAKITSGQLVRYRETKSRWSFAVVRRVAKAGVELRFFDGNRATVPSGEVEALWGRSSNVATHMIGPPGDVID